GHGARRVCRLLAVLGGLAAIGAILQRQITPGRVLGLLLPPTPSANPFGAFVNRNHFAAWLLMVAAPVAGYLIAHVHVHSEYRRSWRRAMREALQSGSVFIAAAAVICAGTLLLTVSRSALTGLGVACACGFLLMRSRLDGRRRARPLMIGVTGAALVVALLFVDVDRWSARLNSTFELTAAGGTRLNIWRETVPIVQDFALTGTGAGTFSDAMRKYQRTRIWVGSMREWLHFNNAHSHYLQIVAEGGLLLLLPALAAVATFVAAAARAIRRDRTERAWMRAGAAAGLIGVAVQSIWEIPLAMPANAVLAAVLAALVVHERAPAPADTPAEGIA
ncbi:MAG TPA: O-antigen ligase family protein, partial [Vicinamibacterales bacterium]|nr:O-antigen ligase family protein [Vicinamibacterales bacterium]